MIDPAHPVAYDPASMSDPWQLSDGTWVAQGVDGQAVAVTPPAASSGPAYTAEADPEDFQALQNTWVLQTKGYPTSHGGTARPVNSYDPLWIAWSRAHNPGDAVAQWAIVWQAWWSGPSGRAWAPAGSAEAAFMADAATVLGSDTSRVWGLLSSTEQAQFAALQNARAGTGAASWSLPRPIGVAPPAPALVAQTSDPWASMFTTTTPAATTTAAATTGLASLFSNPMVLVGVAAVALLVLTKK